VQIQKEPDDKILDRKIEGLLLRFGLDAVLSALRRHPLHAQREKEFSQKRIAKKP